MTIAVIAVIGVFFAGLGCYALAAPTAIIRPFGITLGEAASRSEVRAVYGGFGLSKEATSSIGARTAWVRGLQLGQGNADMGRPPGVLWSFRTTGSDAVDVDRFTVTMRYLAVAD